MSCCYSTGHLWKSKKLRCYGITLGYGFLAGLSIFKSIMRRHVVSVFVTDRSMHLLLVVQIGSVNGLM